jgi:hypothetical protein
MNPLIMQLDRYLRRPSVDPGPLKQRNRDWQIVMAKRRPCRHTELCPPGTFRLPWMWFLSVLFPTVVRQMPGYNTQRRGTARTLPRHGGFTWMPHLRRESSLRHGQSEFESQTAFQPKFAPHKDLLPPGQWPSVCPHRGLQRRRDTR